MAGISQEEISIVRSRADIVDIISHYIQVTRQGREYKALCPFHDDHDPSMRISPEKQIYKCFVCGSGGNVFTFVQNYEKISFPEAVGRVAELVGYRLSETPEAYAEKTDPYKEQIYRALEDMISYSIYQLNMPDAKDKKDYLLKRGMDDTVLKTFQIGWIPEGNSLSNFLKAKGFSERILTEANISSARNGVLRDIFSGRITFPIHDRNGKPVGFSARTLDPSNPSKYINTTETPVFVKGEIVYNAHRARIPARRDGRIYVCEGVTDVIAFYRGGIENAVCTLGTACTKQQIAILKNMAARIVFCYDGDHAGQAATYRAGKMALAAGCDISVIRNETGMDPDEIISRDGKEGLKELVSHEYAWPEFVIHYLFSSINPDNYLEKKDFTAKALAEINELKDEADRRYFTEEISRLSGIHVDFVPRAAQEPILTSPIRNKVPKGAVQAEEQILAMMMSSREAVRMFTEDLGFMNDRMHQHLAMLIVDAASENTGIDVPALIDETDDAEMKNLIARLADSGIAFDRDVMAGVIRRVKITGLMAEAEAYKADLNAELSAKNRELILNQYSECLRELRRYIDEENRS